MSVSKKSLKNHVKYLWKLREIAANRKGSDEGRQWALEQLALREEAIKRGHKDRDCPKCDSPFLAHNHYIRCEEVDCPMRNEK